MRAPLLFLAVLALGLSFPTEALAHQECSIGTTRGCTLTNGCSNGVQMCEDYEDARGFIHAHWGICEPGLGSQRSCTGCGGTGTQTCEGLGSFGPCTRTFNPNGCAVGAREVCTSSGTWQRVSGCSGAAACSTSGTPGDGLCNASCDVYACFSSSCRPNLATLGSTPQGGVYQWPAACFQLHATTNHPFYRVLSDTQKRAELQHPNSTNIVAQLLQTVPNELQGRADGHSGEPTYYSLPTDPEYVIDCDPVADTEGQECFLDGVRVRIPEWAMMENGWSSNFQNRGDGHMTIIDRDNNWEWNLYRVLSRPMPGPSPDGNRYLIVGYANRTPLVGDGLYTERTATAGYVAGTLGRIRLEELEAGEINHALAMVVPCHNNFEGPSRTPERGNIGVVYPAAGPGGFKCPDSTQNQNAPAMGAHFVYTKTPAEIDAIRVNGQPLPQWKRTILKALSRYGAFVTDTGGWAFEQEASYQYSAALYQGGKKWYHFGQNNGWAYWRGEDNVEPSADDRFFGKLFTKTSTGQLDAEGLAIDFANHLKVLHPCVSQGTCN